ncbi:LysR family transcriptional regulator [Lonsdalea quercina]|uniref:LysR family transcriptional regulator n=1 Tax=Lonsdalea quercina TaxID=71657 RepID=UPI003975BCEF
MNEINIGALDLNLLKTFEALYEEGSASRAGVRLGLTQSAVSAALKRLKTTQNAVSRSAVYPQRARIVAHAQSQRTPAAGQRCLEQMP